MKRIRSFPVLLACMFWIQCLVAQVSDQVSAIQYYFDTDPGVNVAGNGAIVSVTPASSVTEYLTIATPTGFSEGIHYLYVRAKDTYGRWGIADRRPFLVVPLASTFENISTIQYFFDADPGVGIAGNGGIVEIAATAPVTQNIAISLSPALSTGLHYLYVRVKHEFGGWSIADRRAIYIMPVSTYATTIDALQYYFDTDPGIGNAGNGGILSFTPTEPYTGTIAITLPELSSGLHYLYVRTRSGTGHTWNFADRRPVYVLGDELTDQVVALEYYYDNDPGQGNANQIAIPAGVSFSGSVELGVPCLSTGTHYVYIRAKDEDGHWSIIERDTITVSSGLTTADISPAGPFTICTGDEVTLSGEALAGASYQWMSNGEPIAGATTNIYDAVASGAYTLKTTCGAAFTTSNTVSITVLPLVTYYADTDGDTYGDAAVTETGCYPPVGFVTDNTDCDDANMNIHPGAAELCNEIDEDCDGIADDGVQTIFYADTDADTFGDMVNTIAACSAPVGYVNNPLDCDDTDANIHPAAAESCNGIDDNCNGSVDEGTLSTFYADADADGYGNMAITQMACTAPSGFVSNNTDCDDTDANEFPGQIWFMDNDVDAYGDGTTISQCDRPAFGYLPSELLNTITDCNNNDNTIHPDAVEVCNSIDDNCNGSVDEGVMTTFYADTDEDGFGDAATAALSCTVLPGYVTDNTDCDDTEPLYFPGQIFYLDQDGDTYGTGAFVINCSPPEQYFPAMALTSATGDCDDNNALINNAAQYYTYSGNVHFTDALVYPSNGDSYQEFRIEAAYFDATNGMPAPSWPRVILDYENNGLFTDANDRTIMMTATDAGDVNTIDGKSYFAVIDGLTPGTDYRVYIQSGDTCVAGMGPFADFVVTELPDLEIFASDILFSDFDPMPGDVITVSATVHNVSTQDAGGFYMHLVNQYDGFIYADMYVPYLNAESSATVTWTITTPLAAAWCPMQVTVDNTFQIAESNELDNMAVRPFVNGDYYVPGDILASAWVSPATTYNTYGSYVYVTGYAMYIEPAVPMPDPDVAGAQVQLTIEETGASFICYTNADGYFSTALSAELPVGTYHISGIVTDFTLMDTIPTLTFTVIPYPALPDLETIVSVSSSSIISGESVNGSVSITNIGSVATSTTSVLDVTQSDGTPVIADVSIPVLLPGESFIYAFSDIVFTGTGSHSICAMADAGFEISELFEYNNDDCALVFAHSPLADIYGGGGMGEEVCDVAPASISVSVTNGGYTATGSFESKVETFVNGVSQGFTYFTITDILPGNTVNQSIPFVNYGYGTYNYVVDLDYLEVLSESSIANNDYSFGGSYYFCLPDLLISECEQVVITPNASSDPTFVDIEVNVQNNGEGLAEGPIDLQLNVDGVGIFNIIHTGNIAPGASALFTISLPAPVSGSMFTAEVNPSETLDEASYFNNDYSAVMCWDLEAKPLCIPDFWESVFVVGQYLYPVIAIENNQVYTAETVEVQFALEGPGIIGSYDLGRAVLSDVKPLCGLCGVSAAAPLPFQFLEPGIYTCTITVDPDNDFDDCVPANNVMVVSIEVTGDPDMRVLSEFIQPSSLNPDESELVSFDLSYENIGFENVGDVMQMQVFVDGVLQETFTGMPGLMTGDNFSVSGTTEWSSTLSGLHIITAKIDSDHDVVESNELNNEATRGIIVGASSNLGFQYLVASNAAPEEGETIDISFEIQNDGEIAMNADVFVYYVSDELDTMLIGSLPVSMTGLSSVPVSLSWNVIDPSTTIIARIMNGSSLEFDYTDNAISYVLGAFSVALIETPESCIGAGDGSIEAIVTGGAAPYTIVWNTGYSGALLSAAPGTYTVTVIDNTGMSAVFIGTIAASVIPGVNYYADNDGDTFGNVAMSINSCTPVAGYVTNSTDCNDAQATTYPGAVELCDGIDNDCDGTIDEEAITAVVSPSGTITICNGQTVTLTANTGAGYTYLWYKNNKPIATATNSVYTANKAGSYKVKVTMPGGCFAISPVTTVTVNPAPNANVTAPLGTSLCTTVRLKAPNVATNTYQWRKGATILAGATNYDYYPTTSGTYRCDVTNTFGCLKTSNAITVTACDMGLLPETNDQELQVYPNPTAGELHVIGSFFENEEKVEVFVTNALGVTVHQESINLDHGNLDYTMQFADDLPSGWYIVRIVASNNQLSSTVLLQR